MIYYTIFAGPFLGRFSKILFTMAPGPQGIISQDLFQGFCMRIIHPELLSTLPVRMLCALHRDCCRFRGKSWGRGRRLQWLWNLPQPTLVWYHSQVLLEMTGRGYSPNVQWFRPEYRGKNLEPMKARLVRVESIPASQMKAEFLGAYPGHIDGCQAFIARWVSKHPNTAGAK